MILSNNGSQLVGAKRKLQEMIRGWDVEQLKEFNAEKGMKWQFATPPEPHQNGCAVSSEEHQDCPEKSNKRARTDTLRVLHVFTGSG